MSKRVGQLEEALAVQSRANASFEAGVNTKLDILHQMVQGMQASLCQVDALGGTVDSMKDAASQVSDVMAEYGDKLRAHEKRIQELSVGHDGSEDESESGHREKTLERLVGLAKEEFMTKGDGAIWTQRLMDEQWEIEKLKKQHESTTTHLRELSSLLERVVANEQVVSKLQVRYEEINKQVVILSSHLSDDRVQEQDKVSRRPVLNMADRVIEQMPAEPSTPRTSGFGKPERFLMTPEAAHQSGLETDNGWYDDAEEEELEAGKQLPPGLSTASPDVGNTRIPPGQWKLIKDFPRLVMPQGDPWEKGMAFRQWATEASALAEAISPLLAEFFRRRLREGQELYERRLRDGCTPPLPAVATSDKEMETRLSLALLKALPASMKQPALEKGSSDEAVSTVALLEAACEVFMPGGISEQVSLQRFLRQLPVANSCKELLGTLRRWRLAEQRAKYLKVPEQAPHESIAALDGLCKQLEKKYTLLGTRLSLMRLQHNIQVPTHDGVSSYLQILEAECTRICAEEQTASRGGSKQGDVGEYDLPAANQAAGGKGVKPLCAYYNTARGCLKGSACTFRHEKQSETSQKGKGAKGKDGKTGKGDKGATKSAEPKAKAKAEAKAAADSTQTPSPKAKTKAEKKAAKAAAKAAASTAATAQESEDIPALAGAACAVQESSSKPHAMMARSWNVEPDSDSDDEGNIPEIPMRADGDTPEWSEVERGEYSSEEAQSDGSDAWIDFQRQPEPLWTLELSVTEYIQWRRPGVVHSRASHEFVETTNPNSICWPLWWRIVHDELDENERGTISVVDGVDILRCDIAQVMFEDQIARPVFLVWLLQEETGNERHIAIIRHQQRPLVFLEEEPERSQAAPPRLAGALSVRPHQVTPWAKAAAYDHRARDARSLIVAEATAEAFESGLPASDDEESHHLSQASADQNSSEAHPSSSGDRPTAMRCVEVEDQCDIPSLVGAKACVVAARLECIDCPVSNAAAESQTTEPSVLVDSGANETIRPWTKDINETGCKHTSVITASGDQVPALKTRDGELCIKASPTSKDWLLSVRRLVDAGGTFCWNKHEAVVSYVDQWGKTQSVRCSIQNGLPFLTWQDFKPIRIMLSKYFKGRSSSALTAKASGGDDGWTECETCTLEELMQHTWDDEVAYVGAELKDEVIQNEAMAREVLSKGPITYQDVWEVLRSAALPTSPKRPRMWVFGYYCHGGIVGITNLTRQRPNLCKLVNAFLQQELPDFTYAAFQIAVDAALAPHRDITNEVGSMSGLIGVSRFEGGRLWVEDRDGMVKRRVAGDEIKVGKLLTVSQQACTFNARAWHGADRHKGVRGPTPQQAPAEIKPGKEFVGGAFLKEAAGSLLLHAQLPLQLWNEAVLEATFLRRCRAIGLVIPKDRPHMGDTVLVRKPSSTEAHPFAPKAEEGIFLANDERTPGGARVMVVRDERNSVRVVRMPVLIDKQSSRWRLEKGPRDQVVWISTCGDIRWDAPPSDLITVEEATGAVQAWNDGNTASEIIRQRFKAHLKPELLFSLFGHGFLIGPEPGEPVIAAAGKQDVPFQEESKENWYRVFDAGTEDAMNEMEVALRLLAEEEITGEPVPSSIFFTGTEHERQPWIKAAEDEVSNMTTNAAWVEVNINNAREELGLGPHERLPKVLPMTVVCTRKPLLMQDDKCESNRDAKKVHDDKGLKAPQSASEVKDLEQRRFKAKVRLCVCGNFEEVKPEMKDANAAETVPVEVLRLLLTLLTMHLTWSALSLDISAAFLNAVLTGKDIILMQPPKSLVRLGLIPEGVWLRAMRAIYGLRQSPARWEELRDSILDGAVLEAAAGDLLPTLVIRAMKGIGGVFLITTRDTQQLVAVACVFVDDVLAIGETEAILRIGEFILKSWKGRLQGMLSRETAQAWMRGTLEVKAKSELVFVGIQMFFRNGGVAMSQQRWVVKQLNVRGYLHLGGSPCLPQVEEGYLLRWGENTLMYKSVRQTLTAFSTCEAETGAMADAIADMLRIESYVTQVGEVSEKLAWGDNAASVACLTKPRFQETLWRTRHFGLRASWIRDVLKESNLAVSHKPGAELTADLLTKTLPRLKLEQFRTAIGVCRVHDDNLHLS
ncbi:Retrovirus-related Pol polyprotein from transposon TNT 1-94 [Symbiodinium microadriaticum]|uniref:Retrovirus-related Pol polyprotein from transposon TNT 1-94 n=1 Tax=Symbiodinium microadriaticum TaxID=2951 RepID=A0A1Q9DIG4_SYMMI|nr:Retrovirus-related Pol polyprotein from transposon TNT 1-94 [Symbiodinium microadriaticum]